MGNITYKQLTLGHEQHSAFLIDKTLINPSGRFLRDFFILVCTAAQMLNNQHHGQQPLRVSSHGTKNVPQKQQYQTTAFLLLKSFHNYNNNNNKKIIDVKTEKR